MPDSLLPARQDFLQRVRSPAIVGHVLAVWPRWIVSLILALSVPAILLLVALAGPRGFLDALTSPANVHATFARFISAIATASAIAVSVASLTFRRDMRGIDKAEDRGRANEDFRARVREAAGLREAPLLVGELVGEVLAAAAGKARDVRAAAGAALDVHASGTTLRAYLDTIEARAERAAGRMPRAWARPDTLHRALLDFDQQVTVALARRFARDPHLHGATREGMEELHALLSQYATLAQMVKMLDLEWGLSRMSQTILLSSLPAIGVAAAMTLTYGVGAAAAWGAGGAAWLVCGALAIALYPIAAFISYLIRFVFLNQHTLPTEGFALGPEVAALTRRPRAGRARG